MKPKSPSIPNFAGELVTMPTIQIASRRIVRSIGLLAAIAVVACDTETSPAGAVSTTINTAAYNNATVRVGTLGMERCAPASRCDMPAVSQIAFADDRIFILGRPELLELTPDSGLVTLARAGAGPGELRAPIAIGASDSGIVWVFDIQRMRTLRIVRGAPTREYATAPPPFFRQMRIRDGQIYALVVPAASQRGDSVTATILRLTPGATSWSDTVASFRTMSDASTGDLGMALPKLPWDARILWDVCGDHSIILASSDRWTIDRYRDGRLTQSVRRPGASTRAIPSAERDSLARNYLDHSPRIPAFREALEKRMRDAPALPMLIDALHCDLDGTVFVKNHRAFGAAASRWDVISVRGSVDHALQVSADPAIFGVLRGRLFGLLVDASGDGSVVFVAPAH